MAYDLEKYRDKREKVLGVKKRGISFGTLAMIVSLTIITGLGVVVIPKSIAFFHMRHLDDAIYKVQNGTTWPQQVLAQTEMLAGVTGVEADSHSTRIVITFNWSRLTCPRLASRQAGPWARKISATSRAGRMAVGYGAVLFLVLRFIRRAGGSDSSSSGLSTLAIRPVATRV